MPPSHYMREVYTRCNAPWDRPAKNTGLSVNVFKDPSPIVNHPHFHMLKKEKKKAP